MAKRKAEAEAQTETALFERGVQWKAHEDWKRGVRQRAEKGKVVIREKEQPFELMEQGYSRFVVGPWMKDVASTVMYFHSQLIPRQSGRHVHQGGIGLFILEGRGYSVVDGVRYDWKEGDLVLLPIKKGGCEHQHFNLDPSKSARWLRIGPRCTHKILGGYTHQKEVAPAWRGKYGDKIVSP